MVHIDELNIVETSLKTRPLDVPGLAAVGRPQDIIGANKGSVIGVGEMNGIEAAGSSRFLGGPGQAAVGGVEDAVALAADPSVKGICEEEALNDVHAPCQVTGHKLPSLSAVDCAVDLTRPAGPHPAVTRIGEMQGGYGDPGGAGVLPVPDWIRRGEQRKKENGHGQQG